MDPDAGEDSAKAAAKAEKKRHKMQLKAEKKRAKTRGETVQVPTAVDNGPAAEGERKKPWYRQPEWIRAIAAVASLIVTIIAVVLAIVFGVPT